MATLNLSNTELKAAADVSEVDVVLAVALWRRYAPAAYRSIIETDDTIYQWSQSEMIYRRNGVKVDPLKLKSGAIEPFLANVKTAMRDLTAQVQRGDITVAEWQQQMNDLVKASQLAAALVANGGTRNSTQNDYAAIALTILAMLTFAQVFAKDIDSGKQPLNGSILARAGLYANAARDAYEETRRVGMEKYAGAEFERRVLANGAEHCHSTDTQDGCVELAALGWQPIGTLPRIYDTPCRTNCLCHFEYK